MVTPKNSGEEGLELGAEATPALPLGSGPSVDVDLVYRRVEEGDVIAVVSTSLARLLDRSLAEEIFSSGDADFIIDELYELASGNGLAEAHACVLLFGAEATSGVDTDLTLPEPGQGSDDLVTVPPRSRRRGPDREPE